MYFWTRLHLEICAAVRDGKDHLSFDACFEAGVRVATALYLNAQYNKALKSTPK
jgi:hypothetical protein